MEIDNLELKLKGKLPINRYELFELVSSWGRKDTFETEDRILIKHCKPNECYPLENLDVSQITDLSFIFRESLYNGDISKWNISNVTNVLMIFAWADFNNDSLKDWNVTNIRNMECMFFYSLFNGDISKWDVSKNEHFQEMFWRSKFTGDISSWKFNENANCEDIFFNNVDFEDKYNNGMSISMNTKQFLVWFETNKKNISNANVSKEEILDIDYYLSSFKLDINNL